MQRHVGICAPLSSQQGLVFRSSPRSWSIHLRRFLLSYGFIVCDAADHSLFKFMFNGVCVIRIAVVVDDCLIAYPKAYKHVYESFIAKVQEFAKCTISEPDVFVNLYLIRDRMLRRIYIHQHYAVKKILDQYCPDGHGRDTPADQKDRVSKDDCPEPGSSEQQYMKTQPFREILGCLLYVAISTRFDILVICVMLSAVGQNPGRTHMNMLNNVLRYLLKGYVNSFIGFQ